MSAKKVTSICAVADCKGPYDKESWHKFPKKEDLRSIWTQFCKRSDSRFNPNTARICSRHFKKDDFVRDLKAELLNLSKTKAKLKDGVVPSLRVPGTSLKRDAEEASLR